MRHAPDVVFLSTSIYVTQGHKTRINKVALQLLSKQPALPGLHHKKYENMERASLLIAGTDFGVSCGADMC
jgi:hypothetical protein